MASPEYQGIIENKGMQGLKGLRGWGELSQEEKSSWLDAHPNAKGLSSARQAILYRNRQYYDTLGPEVYDKYDIPTLGKLYEDNVVNKAFDYYKDDSDFENLSNILTTEGKKEMLESGRVPEKEWDKEVNTKYDEYSKGMQEGLKWYPAGAPVIGTEIKSREDFINEYKAKRLEDTEKLINKDNKRKREESQGEIDELAKFFSDKQNNWITANELFSNVMNNQEDIDNVIDYMSNNALITPQQGTILKGRGMEQKLNLVGNILQTSDFNPARIDSLYDSISLPREVETTSNFGEVEAYQMPGSRTYAALKDTDRFKNFSASDKLREYATWQVLAQKYGPLAAITNLEQSMAEYAKENEGMKEWTQDVLTNITLGGVANIMNKINGVNNLIVEQKYGTEGLANKLQGKNADGTEREQTENGSVFNWFLDNWDNPAYWSKVDQYNTLDPLQIAAADLNGGISPFTTTKIPGEEVKFFSGETLREALKMAKFAWSDYLVGMGLARVSNLASVGAARIAPWLGKGVRATGALGELAASAVGISESYGVMTYEQAYQEMLENLDAQREALVKANVEEYKKTPEAQARIDEVVNRLMEQQRANNVGKENPLYVSEDEIRRQVEADFDNYFSQQERNRDSFISSRAEDEKLAQRAAANAYMVDATVEQARMMLSNFVFRDYLFDRGSLKALGKNTDYSKVNFNPVTGELEQGNRILNKATAMAKPIIGGFESNYFDDVTVGFGKGFGLGQYNAYLQDKYNPKNAVEASDYPLSFVAGLDEALTGAVTALSDRQSFYDGFIGGLGAPLSLTPRLTRREIRSAKESMNKKEGEKLNTMEWVNTHFMNPLIQGYYDAKGREERTDKILPIVNKTIADKGSQLENIVQLVSGVSELEKASVSGSLRDRKDAKEREAFKLLYALEAVEGSPLIKDFPLVQNAFAEIDRLASGNVTDEEITGFMSRPENKGAYVEEARQQIIDNAKSLKQMSKKIGEARDIINGSIKLSGITEDLKEQLIFQLSADKSWNERLADIESTISGSSRPSTAHSAIAAYGSKAEFERQLNAQISLIKELSKLTDAAKKEIDLFSNKDDSLTEEEKDFNRKNFLRSKLVFEQYRETYKDAKLKLKQMKEDARFFEEDNKQPVLSASQILSLNPVERNTILHKKNRKNYSEEQQQQIDKALEELSIKSPDAAQLVFDAAALYDRIQDNKVAYRRIQDNLDAASAYVEAIKASRASQFKNVLLRRKLDETYELFNNTSSNEELLEVAKSALSSKDYGFNSTHLRTYIERNPEKGEVLKGLYEVSKLREDANSSIRETISSREMANDMVVKFTEATNDVNNGQEAMESLEALMDAQPSASTRLQYDRVLERMKELGYQRDATRIRNREEERKRKQEEEIAKAEEEKKRDGGNYNWSGYKVGDTVYNKETGNQGIVAGFETTEDGSNKMLIRVGDRVVKYDSVTGKDKVSKETPAKEKGPIDRKAIDISEFASPEQDMSNVVELGVEDVELDSEGATQSPTAAQQAISNQTQLIQVPENDSSEQGNVFTDSSNKTITGNRLVEYSIQDLKNGVVKAETPESDSSTFGQFRQWLDNNKIKLQEIIDEELGRMLQDNPDLEIRFMLMNTKSSLGRLMFPVVELTPQIRDKYHDSSRGGIIQANGKSWLVVGSTGFESNATAARRSEWDSMYGPINKRKAIYFQTNSAEQYYVDDIAKTKVQSTTSGRIVNQRLNDEAPKLQKVSDLLKSSGKSLRQAEFGIQTAQVGEKSFATTKNVGDRATVFPPRNVEDNRGRTFILIDTPLGNKIPGMIEPSMYNNIEEGSPLKEWINNTIAGLFSTEYEVRRKAISELRGFLVLNDNKNILIGTKDIPTLTIRRAGMPDITQKLGATFDMAKFFADLENANFQINTTLKNLEDADILEMYDESGALMTSVASMKTVGMSYSLYMTDEFGKPIILTPVANAKPGTGVSEIRRYKSVRVDNVTYERRNGVFINRNTKQEVDSNSPLGISCLYNLAIKEGQREPFMVKNNKEYYQAMVGQEQRVITRDGLGNIEILSFEESQRINNDIKKEQEQADRAKNLEDVDLGEDTTSTPQRVKTEVPLTQEQIAQQAIGNFDAPAQSNVESLPKTEVVKEAKESQPTQAKEVISDIGKKSLSDLQNTENLSTFADVANSVKYGDTLYDILEGKNWEITGDPKVDIEILKSHNIETSNIGNIENWLNLIRDCR